MNPYNQGDGGDNTYNLVSGQYNFMLQNAQDFLIELDYGSYLGTAGADGIWGIQSKTAIQQFQSDHQTLEVTEYLNAETYNYLRDLWLQEMRDNYNSLNFSKKYWIDWMDTYINSVIGGPTEDPESSDNPFGASRGTRTHAGIDYHANIGTNVVAVTSGDIIYYNPIFYYGTESIAIKNTDGSITHYTEIEVSSSIIQLMGAKGQSGSEEEFEPGDISINRGDILGQTIPNTNTNGCMLHFEAYSGDYLNGDFPTYAYTSNNGANADYDYLDPTEYPDRNFNRRPDLLDPTWSRYLNQI